MAPRSGFYHVLGGVEPAVGLATVGLRRYPVVFYFHTRRVERSIPRIFAALGDLIELVRWGLPADEPLTRHPYLLALADEYATTVGRLQRSFVGPVHDTLPTPLPETSFWADYCRTQPADPFVRAFRSPSDEAAQAAGLTGDPHAPDARAYDRYREWLVRGVLPCPRGRRGRGPARCHAQARLPATRRSDLGHTEIVGLQPVTAARP